MSQSLDAGQSGVWRSVDQNVAFATHYLNLLSGLIDEIKGRATGALRLSPGNRVLEIGCGVGRDAEIMARIVAPGGQVIATDLSGELVAQANSRVAALGLPLEYRVADAMNLPFPDASFDAARVERVLQHLPDPARAVTEMARVVRPGGRVVAFEPDWETMAAAGGSATALRALRAFKVDVASAHGGIGRQTPKLFHGAKCRDMFIEGVIFHTQSLGVAETVLSLKACLDGAVAKSWLSEADALAWWNEARALDAVGAFYASLSGTIVAATVS